MTLNGVREFFEMVQAALTSGALIAAAIWTYMLFVKKRQKYPRASIEHTIQCMSVSHEKCVVRVTVGISNIGEVLLPLESVEVRLLQMVPWRDDALGTIDLAQEDQNAQTCELGWPVIAERTSEWCPGVQEIEPAEEDKFNFDFIVDKDVQTVSVYSHVKNAYKKHHLVRRWKTREIGWNTTTVHQLNEKEEL